MQVMGKLMDHVRLVSRMAKATRTDLVKARNVGDLSQAEWAAMVQTCRKCDWSAQCPDWLDRHEAAGDAPKQCPNRAKFNSLKTAARRWQTEEA